MKQSLVFGLLIVLLASIPACFSAHNTEADAVSTLPDLDAWLTSHPRIANAIKWQHEPADLSDPFAPPVEKNKVAWPDWTQSRKDELNKAYLDSAAWFSAGAIQLPMDPDGLTDEPANLHPDKADGASAAAEWVSPAYLWKLYISHVAFSLVVEITGRVPWSIVEYDDESLRYLFDSTTLAWNINGTHFSLGTSDERIPVKRADNLPRTAFAPPAWTFPFLREEGLIGLTRIETIGSVLEWTRRNLDHFYGNNSFGNYFAVWHHRGYPPLSKIVHGTLDMNYPHLGLRRWTAGCHGSVGFLNALLRVLNIPVQPVWICGHELPYFISEKMYLDHGDNSYNGNVKSSDIGVLSLLIDQETYRSWFTEDISVNITDNASPVCRNVGRKITGLR